MAKKETNEQQEQAVTAAATALAVREEQGLENAIPYSEALAKFQLEEEHELQHLLREVELGFSAVKPSTIAKRNEPFDIVDAIINREFVDRKNGEVKTLIKFVLEYPATGETVVMMQTATIPRMAYAVALEKARNLGKRIRFTNRKLVELEMGEINPAIIFETQPGGRILIER